MAGHLSIEMDTHKSLKKPLSEIISFYKGSMLNPQDMMTENRRKKVMAWMESRYPVLTEVLQTTLTVDSFHLAEENKKEFPHKDAAEAAKEMVNKLLNTDEYLDPNFPLRRREYLKSMFLCVTPESLTPLAALMYEEFEKTCPENLHMVFQYEDEKKVMQLCICLFVRGLLSDRAEQICKDIKTVQVTVEKMIKKEVKGAPEQLLAACRTVEVTERSFYSAFRGWKEIPQSDAEIITKAMVKLLTETDKEKEAFLESMYFSLRHRRLLPLVIVMFQKYREVCPDKLELLKGQHNEEWNPKFLGRVLLRRRLLTEEEYDKFFSKLTSEELHGTEKRRKEFERHDLSDFFDRIWNELPHAYDVLDYHRLPLPYDDAVAISKLMLPFLNDDIEDREIYLKTMTNLSYRRKFWELSNVKVAALTKEYSAGDKSIIGEYNKVAVIMCQQYMDQFPDCYSEFEENISPQYLYLFFVKCLWQRNMLSEVAVSFYVQTILDQQRDELTISHGFQPLLFTLPTTVYMPAIISSEASDFSESIWLQSSHDFNQISFMRILVAAAIEREEQSHSKHEALYQVLVKAIRNHKSANTKVELILDVILPQVQSHDCDLWDNRSDSDPLYLLAARRGPQFVPVAFKLLEFVEQRFDNHRESMSSRVIQLIQDEATDDYTVTNITNKVIDSEAFEFSDSETVDLARCCSSYAGKGSRSLTAMLLWKYYSHLLNFLDLLSTAESEDVPFTILEEFNIFLYSHTKAEKYSNTLHLAAERGYTGVVELALERGFTKLLTYSNEKDQYPVQVALEREHFETAAVMLRAMNDYKLCLAESSDGANSIDGVASGPRVNFRKLLDRLKELAKLFESSEDESERTDIVHKGEALEGCVAAILESTVDRRDGLNYHAVLEVDYKGNTPDNKDFDCPSMHSIEFVMRYQKYFQDIIEHESFQSLVNRKWKVYGQKIFLIYFVIYLIFLAFLTTAFALGAVRPESPAIYNQPLDWFRLFCEIVVLLLIIVDIMFEINQFCHNVCITSWRVYVTDWTNWLDDLAILMTLLVIPFRIADIGEQWVFVALAYILHCLRIFKYAVIKSSFAVYVKALFQIIKRDIVQFLTVFIVITIAFGGGLYFSLRAEDTCRLADQMMTDEAQFNFTPVINTSLCLHPDETSQIYLSWLTGLRLLIEGNVIDPYIFGDRGFWWFSVIIYMVFLFLVAVIMLNLLIAQFSKSYEEITTAARQSVTPDRAKILVEQQSTAWIRASCDIVMVDVDEWGRKFMSASTLYRETSPYNKSNDETVSDLGKIHKQLLSSTSTDQKQFKELRAQLKEVKADQVTTDYLREEMNKQAVQIQQAVQSDLTSQSEVVKELQSEVRSLATALREQTEIAMEQQRQIKESLKSLREVKDVLQQLKVQEDIVNSNEEQAAKMKTIKSELSSQSEVVRHLATALHRQTELVMEQQKQMKESLKELGEVKNMLQEMNDIVRA